VASFAVKRQQASHKDRQGFIGLVYNPVRPLTFLDSTWYPKSGENTYDNFLTRPSKYIIITSNAKCKI